MRTGGHVQPSRATSNPLKTVTWERVRDRSTSAQVQLFCHMAQADGRSAINAMTGLYPQTAAFSVI